MHPMGLCCTMPATNPRLTITLTPAVAAMLREMSQLAGNSQSAIVGDLLETSLPVFERVIHALRAASTIQAAAKTEIAAGLDRAQAKLEDHLQLVLDDMDTGMRPLLDRAEQVTRRAGGARGAVATRSVASAPRAGASKAVLTPVPVTRGSGVHPGVKTGKGKSRGRRV
jgi:hypothetical protein